MAFAVRVYQHGGPEVLKYEEVQLPEPAPGEVRIKQFHLMPRIEQWSADAQQTQWW